MAAKYRVKQYVEGGFYHVYNRGVERRRIFLDDQDYRVFLHLLKFYLSEPQTPNEHPLQSLTGFTPVKLRPLKTLHGSVELHCYCLMPTHFHLLLKQRDERSMEKLLRRILTNYSMYFNRRYERVGHLFQGAYKAVLVDEDNYLLHLSRYIHQNPTLTKRYLHQYPYSSYSDYIGEKRTPWLTTSFILDFFKVPKNDELKLKEFANYKGFVENYDQEPEEIIGKLAIEPD